MPNGYSYKLDNGTHYIWNVWKDKTMLKVLEALQFYIKYVTEKMEEPKSGKDYSKTDIPGHMGERISWTASKPGEYPAVRTGDLVNALQMAAGLDTTYARHVIGKIVLPGLDSSGRDIRNYAIEILNNDIRPWIERAWIECEDDIKDILGPKLIGALNGEDIDIYSRNKLTSEEGLWQSSSDPYTDLKLQQRYGYEDTEV